MPLPTDRPTVPPSFDVEEFARESDSRVAVASQSPDNDLLDPSSEVRISNRPPIGDFLTHEAWAAQLMGLPVVTMSADVLKRLPLDHRAGFLISLIDGTIDLDTIVEISCMERDEVLRVVRDLNELGVVAFR